ncbi:MAG: ABC transporter ATP-binding protein [Bdellovibrionales bacterium]|nr:ABC transporter ATP-binding protein [Bdellovibrionales bacterium]
MTQPSLEVFGLDYFADQDRQVLFDVTFSLEPKQRVALLGPNGSGKSTLLKRIAGIHRSRLSPGAQIRFAGRLQHEFSSMELAREVTYVGPEFRADFPLSASDAVSMGRFPHGDRFSSETKDRVHDAMERMGCWKLRFQNMNEISHGERQRVALARAIVQDPKVLLLDEALSQIDLNHQFMLEDQLSKWMEARSIILVSHDWNLSLRFSDSVFLIHEGKMLKTGSAEQVLSSEAMKKAFPGIQLNYSKGRLEIDRRP